MKELSPAAQVVLAAANNACCYGPDDVLNDSRWIAAAALRAAAEQGETLYLEGCPVHAVTLGNLLAIANELEAQ